jgi:N-acetylneuraminate epimerase
MLVTLGAGSQKPQPRVQRLAEWPDVHGVAGAFAGVHRGRLLAGGGANFPAGMPWEGGVKTWHDRVFALAPQAGASWREIGRLPEPNAYGVSLTIEEGVLIIGGGTATRNFSAVSLMSAEGDSLAYQELPSLPRPLAQMAGAIAGRGVHVVGGAHQPDAREASSRHYRLDLDAIHRGWREMPALPAAGRILPVAAVVAGDLYVIGGCTLRAGLDGGVVRTYLREVWRFAAGEWKRLADLPTPLAAAATPAPAVGDDIYVISGDDGSQAGLTAPARHKGFRTTFLRYATRANAWSAAGTLPFPAPVTLPAVPWNDGFVLVSGEIRPGVRTPQVLLFRPGR